GILTSTLYFCGQIPHPCPSPPVERGDGAQRRRERQRKKSMPGQSKEVRNRIKSVQSSQQITKGMKMVSAAKLRRAQDAIIQMRPYARKLQEMLSNIVSGSAGDLSIGLANERTIEKVLIISITSDRG